LPFFLAVPLNSKLTVAVFPYNLNHTEMDSTYCMVLQFCAHVHIKQRSKIICVTWQQITNNLMCARTALPEAQTYWFQTFFLFWYCHGLTPAGN